MLVKTRPHSVDIVVASAPNLDEALSKAVGILLSTVAANKYGIPVTRHSHELYMSDVHPSLPFGLAHEIST